MKAMETTRINPTGEFPEPLPIPEAAKAIAKLDGYTENQTDKADMERQWPQLKGQFLIDRERHRSLGQRRVRRPRASPGSGSSRRRRRSSRPCAPCRAPDRGRR